MDLDSAATITSKLINLYNLFKYISIIKYTVDKLKTDSNLYTPLVLKLSC